MKLMFYKWDGYFWSVKYEEMEVITMKVIQQEKG